MSKFVVSLWWGYCSGAALFSIHGEKLSLVAASSEERFTRSKNTVEFPHLTLDWFQREFGLNRSNLICITMTGNDVGADYILYKKHLWDIADYVCENKNFYYPKLIKGEERTSADYHQLFQHKWNANQYPGDAFWIAHTHNATLEDINSKWDSIASQVIRHYFDDKQGAIPIFHADHHESHAYYAFFTQDQKDPTLVFTADGWGDGRNATVSLIAPDANGVAQRTEIHSSSACNMGRIYRFMTLMLGMKPSDHEFKVMGLAPYGKADYSDHCYQVFMDAMQFTDGEFHINPLLTDSYYWFKERLEGERFDNIASGLQHWLEENMVRWVDFYVQKTGVRRIAFSGGVAMNVKAMGVIAQLPCVQTLHVPPSSGDESHIFGAAYAYAKAKNFPCNQVEWNGTPYLGYQTDDADELSLVESIQNQATTNTPYIVHPNPDPVLVANALANGYSIGVCKGRAEFGARALGNRSLLIDPTNGPLKERLNLSIKNRDFWMPFAPIVLDSAMPTYLKNLGTHQTRYMTVAFLTTAQGRKDLEHAVHPADGSCRVQQLTAADNPFLYQVMDAFHQMTGRGGLLNTSFNVHGAPVVNTAADAFAIFSSTEIDCLLLNNFLITKRDVQISSSKRNNSAGNSTPSDRKS